VSGGKFELSVENLLLVEPSQLVACLEKYDLTEEDIVAILSANSLSMSVKKSVVERIEDYAERITVSATWDLVARVVVKCRLKFSSEQISLLIGRALEEDVIKILLLSGLDVGGYRSVLAGLPAPMSKLTVLNARPVVIATQVNRDLVKKLQEFGLIKTSREIDNGKIQLRMEKTLNSK